MWNSRQFSLESEIKYRIECECVSHRTTWGDQSVDSFVFFFCDDEWSVTQKTYHYAESTHCAMTIVYYIIIPFSYFGCLKQAHNTHTYLYAWQHRGMCMIAEKKHFCDLKLRKFCAGFFLRTRVCEFLFIIFFCFICGTDLPPPSPQSIFAHGIVI